MRGKRCLTATRSFPKGRPTSGDARPNAGASGHAGANVRPGAADCLGGRMTERGLVISGLGYYPNPLSPDPAHREMVIGLL